MRAAARRGAGARPRRRPTWPRSNLGLKVYDCYRPARAVAAFARWAQERPTTAPTKRFIPTLEKRALFARGYIAAHSAHSTGIAVDLTLVALPRRAGAGLRPATRLTAPAPRRPSQRAPDNSLDMGTGFDCFDDDEPHRKRRDRAGAARRRALLVAAMRKRGFHNYFREWWHFSFGARPAQAYDFPIEPIR